MTVSALLLSKFGIVGSITYLHPSGNLDDGGIGCAFLLTEILQHIYDIGV